MIKFGLSGFITGDSIMPRELANEAEASSFDPDNMEVSIHNALADAGVIEGYEKAGVSRVLLFAPPLGAATSQSRYWTDTED
jgi:hypothetical protein